MRIVVVTIEPPDPFGNAAARWFFVLLRGLVARGHDVTMFSTSSNAQSRQRAEELFPRPSYDLRCFTSERQTGPLGKLRTLRQPLSYVFSPTFRRELARELTRGFDVLHLEQLFSGWVGWAYPDKTLLNVLTLYNVDFIGIPARGVRERLRRLHTFRAERKILRHYPQIATLSTRLAGEIRRLAPRRSASVVRLGIDASMYPFSEEDPPGPLTVGVIGTFSWQPTHRAANRVLFKLWSRIKNALPNVRLLMVGRDARRFLGAHERPGEIEVIENVPDIIPYFKRLHVLLYPPEHGSGTKVKVQEAMALGVPVVTTTDGAEGIPAADGIQIGLCDDDEGLATRTIALLREPALRRARRTAARALIEYEFSPERSVSTVLEHHQAIAAKNSQR